MYVCHKCWLSSIIFTLNKIESKMKKRSDYLEIGNDDKSSCPEPREDPESGSTVVRKVKYDLDTLCSSMILVFLT